MPRVQLPDGNIAEFPDGMSTADIESVLRRQYPAPQTKPTPIDISPNMDRALRAEMAGRSWLGNQWASAGSTLNDVYLRAKQLAGKDVGPEIEANRAIQRGAPVGAVAGEVAKFLPLAFIPGVNTLAGGVASGALSGLLRPTMADESTAVNTVLGAGLGGATSVVTNAVPSVVKGIVRPFWSGGQDRIVGETIKRFGGDAVQGARTARTPGWLPTLAEATGNPGIATLERGAASKSPFLGRVLDERRLAQNIAAKNALEGIAGTADERAAALAARSAAAQPLYEQAAREGVKGPAEFGSAWPQMEGQIKAFLERPAARKALEKAKNIFREADLDFSPQGSVRGLQLLKQAFDDIIDRAGSPASGIGRNELAAIKQSRADLIGMIETLSPTQRVADETYRALSRPIGEQRIGQTLVEKLAPAITDFQPGAPSRLLPNQFASALRDPDALARRATGYGAARYEKIMSPEARATVRGVAEDLANRAATLDAARGVGSNTAQNLASQQLLERIAGSVGMPRSWTDAAAASTIGQSFMRPAQWAAKIPEERIQEKLARALLDPDYAREIMSAGPTPLSLEIAKRLKAAPIPLSLGFAPQFQQE